MGIIGSQGSPVLFPLTQLPRRGEVSVQSWGVVCPSSIYTVGLY